MSETQRPGKALPLPHRVGGNLALDLANTFSFRGTTREIDYLADAEGILAWAKDTGLIGNGFRMVATNRAALVADVRHLRRAVDEAFGAISHGATPPKPALTTIRDLAARSLANATLAGAPAAFEFSGTHAIVGPLAWAALDLLRSDELARLKQCPPHDCRWLFIDRTKNGSRRWCEMATCGDRAKKNAQR
jgi:predicted RNA-binding Zn ribbon-like protein